ncbi:MAG TPA: phenylacetate--CoA ligase PaaK [Nakamurella sp.]|nr:phenylacetate--CoA ligase PaaK [Nakamurella sp.]
MTQLGQPPEPELLDAAERMSGDELRDLQDRRLAQTVAHAYANVPHYRRALDVAGVRPDDITGVEQIAALPFTGKAEMRQNYPFGMFAVPRSEVVRIHASSGTTGRPVIAGYTAADLEMWAEVVARSLRAAGVRAGDLVHNAYGYGLFTGGLGAHAGAERLGCTVVPVSGGMTARQVQLIADLAPDVICCTPTYLLTILDGFADAGIDPAATSLRIAVLGAEPWTDAMRDDLEQRAGLHALNIYGLTEVIGPGVGCECIETKDGITIWEDHFLPEIVDPVTGDPLPDGELGELVFTSLTKQAMPVIRYRTRDLTRLLPGTARPMRRIDRISGRTDDMLIIRGVNVFPTQIEELVVAAPGLSPHFVLELTRPARMDELTVRVEAGHGLADPAAREAVARRLCHAIKDRIGVTAAVVVVDPSTLERSAGKLRRVYDRR